jgi:hypothetical protein
MVGRATKVGQLDTTGQAVRFLQRRQFDWKKIIIPFGDLSGLVIDDATASTVERNRASRFQSAEQ